MGASETGKLSGGNGRAMGTGMGREGVRGKRKKGGGIITKVYMLLKKRIQCP